MPTVFQPGLPYDQAIFDACDALCVLAGTERPIAGFDSLVQAQKKGCAAVEALAAAGIPSDAVVAALAARVTSLEAVQYIVAAANAAVPNAKVIASSPTIQFSTVGSSVQAQAIGDAIKFNILSAGTNVAGTQATVRFSNSNGVSFGMNTNNVMTASHNGLTSQSNQVASADNGSFAFQTLSFSNLNGVSFGTSAGSAIWASHNGLTSQSNQAFSADGGSSAFQTLGFSNGGGVSFTNTNGSVGASVRTDYASSNHSHGNPTLALTNLTGTTASASNGFTLSLSAAAPVTTAGLISAVNFSAGTTSNNLSALTFSNGSGVSFGLNGSVVTASVETNYQTPGAYLTTAMASNRGSDFVQATAAFAGTNASGTIASDGISISVAAPGAGGGFAAKGSGAYTQNTGTIEFANSNGITFGLSTNQMTASYTVPSTAGLISAINVSAGTTSNNMSALTFANGSGVSFGLNGSVLTATVQTNYLTTAMQSNAATISNINLSAGTTSLNASAFTFANGNGVSFGLSGNSVITGSHNGITTARASTDAIGLNTALTANGVSMTANSSGLSLNFPAFLTTAMASNRGSDFVAATAAFAGTNASGTIASNGISISVNAGGGDAIRGIAANGSTASTNTVNFSNANGVSFGFGAAGNSTVMTASHNGLTTARASNDGLGLATAQTNVTWTANSAGLSFNAAGYAGTGTSATNATFTLNSNGLALSVAAPGAAAAPVLDLFANFDLGVGTAQQFAFSNLNARTNSVIVQPLMGNYDLFPGAITINTMYLKCSMSASTATMSSAHTVSVFVGLYTNNANTLSLLNSVSTSWGSGAGNANLSTVFAGIRWLSIHSSAWSAQPVLGQSHYYWGMMLRTAGQSYNVSAAFAGNTIWGSATATASGTIGVATVASANSRGMGPWYGVYTVGTAALPTAIQTDGLNKNTDVAIFNPLVLLVRSGPTTF